MGSGDGEGETGSKDDGDGSAKFHGETTGRGLEGESVTEIAHEMVSISPETDDEGGGGVTEDPDGDLGLCGGGVCRPDHVDGSERAGGVGDIVGTVGKGGGTGSDTLEKGEQVFGLVVILFSAGMHIFNVLCEEGAVAGLVVDNVLGETVGDGELDETVPVLWFEEEG